MAGGGSNNQILNFPSLKHLHEQFFLLVRPVYELIPLHDRGNYGPESMRQLSSLVLDSLSNSRLIIATHLIAFHSNTFQTFLLQSYYSLFD